jgi:hypothetical protein
VNKAAKLFEIALAGCVQDGARPQKQQRFEQRVIEDVERRRRKTWPRSLLLSGAVTSRAADGDDDQRNSSEHRDADGDGEHGGAGVRI